MNAQSDMAERSGEPRPSVAPMEGKGFYNKNAAIPGAGGALALPLLEQAAGMIDLDGGERPIVLADYGSSEGKNSLPPMRAAIAVLRARIGLKRPIFVYHTDLPANDFSSLFQVLHSHSDSYLRCDQNVFAGAIGRSFYQSVLPPNYVDLGWSSYAAVWLSRIPCQIPDHFFIPCSTATARAEFDRQAALDWETFLSLRAAELRPTGRLVVALPGLPENEPTGFATLMDQANAALADLVARGLVSTKEREGMALASCPRRERDLLVPFSRDGQFHGLTVEHCSTSVVPDTVWEEYLCDKDAEALARKRARFFRAVFVPSLAQALDPKCPPDERLRFGAALEDGVRARMVNHPAPIDNSVQIIVLAKQAAA